MSNISIAEFIVYGMICYSSLLMLIISTIKTMPDEGSRINTLARCIFLLPGLIVAPVLATSGPDIQLATIDTSAVTRSINTTQVWQENTTQVNNIVLQNPVWLTVHMMIFFVLLMYIIRQLLLFLMATP